MTSEKTCLVSLVTRCLKKVYDKQIAKCPKLVVDLNKALVNGELYYIDMIYSFLSNPISNKFLKEKIINVNNSNLSLLNFGVLQNNEIIKKYFWIT